MEDTELLRRYVEDGSEAAFAELVKRHLNLVHSVAMRRLGGDYHRANDVVQAVFTDLARKAPSLVSHRLLVGWLHTSAVYASARSMHTESRRKFREKESTHMQDMAAPVTPEIDWDRARPALDDIINTLGERDRAAVLWRFFNEHPLAVVGQKLGVSENAARMRVDRALEKMRTAFAKRGFESSAAALGLMLANGCVSAAPAGLAEMVTATALASAAGAAPPLITLGKIFAKVAAALGSSAGVWVAGILAVSTVFVAGYAIATDGHDRAELAAAQGEIQAKVAQLRTWDDRARTLEGTRMALLARIHGSKQTGAGSHSRTNVVDAAAEGRKFLRIYPQVRAMEIQGNVPAVVRIFAPLFRNANFTPAQIEQFEVLTGSTWIDGISITPTQVGAPDDPSFEQMSRAMGVEVAQEYESFEQVFRYPYEFTNAAAADAAMAGCPLSDGQADRVARIIEKNTAPYARASNGLGPGNWNSAVTAVNWHAAIAEVQTVLSAGQFSAAQSELLWLQSDAAEVRAQQGAAGAGSP